MNTTQKELLIFATTDGDLYRGHGTAILKNLAGKVRKGQYSETQAAKLWRYLADNAAKKYTFDYDNHGTARTWHAVKGFGAFSVADRNAVAAELEKHYREEVMQMASVKKNPVATGLKKYHVTVDIDGSVHGFRVKAKSKSEAEEKAEQRAAKKFAGEWEEISTVAIEENTIGGVLSTMNSISGLFPNPRGKAKRNPARKRQDKGITVSPDREMYRRYSIIKMLGGGYVIERGGTRIAYAGTPVIARQMIDEIADPRDNPARRKRGNGPHKSARIKHREQGRPAWVVHESRNGTHWNEIAAFPADDAGHKHAKQYAKAMHRASPHLWYSLKLER